MVVLRNISQLISNNESLVIGPDVNPAVQCGIRRIRGRDLAQICSTTKKHTNSHQVSLIQTQVDYSCRQEKQLWSLLLSGRIVRRTE